MSTSDTITADEFLVSKQELIETIDAKEGLTMLPAVAAEAIELAGDPNCSFTNFSALIEKDSSLVTDILSLSNSAFYRTRSEITSIKQAVGLIGLTECKNLVISSSMKALLAKMPKSVEWTRNVLWKHSLQTATIARHLNESFKLGFNGEEFAGAIVHDLGRLLVGVAAPSVFEMVDRLTFNESPDLLAHEQSMIETDHCELGAHFAAQGKLPKDLVDVILHHHAPDACDGNRELVAVVGAADEIANHLMFFGSPEGFELLDESRLMKCIAEHPSIDGDAATKAAIASMELAAEAVKNISTVSL